MADFDTENHGYYEDPDGEDNEQSISGLGSDLFNWLFFSFCCCLSVLVLLV